MRAIWRWNPPKHHTNLKILESKIVTQNLKKSLLAGTTHNKYQQKNPVWVDSSLATSGGSPLQMFYKTAVLKFPQIHKLQNRYSPIDNLSVLSTKPAIVLEDL